MPVSVRVSGITSFPNTKEHSVADRVVNVGPSVLQQSAGFHYVPYCNILDRRNVPRYRFERGGTSRSGISRAIPRFMASPTIMRGRVVYLLLWVYL